MDRAGLRWGVAIIGAVVVAELAVLALRPRSGVIEPAAVREQSYFSASQLQRARSFRGPQLVLQGGALAVQLAALAALVARPPARLRAPFRRPVLAAAAAGAALSLLLLAVALPLQAAARERARDAGLVTQSWAGYARDRAIGGAVAALLAAAGAAAAVALMRRLPRAWWAPGSALLVAFGAAFVYAGPVVLDPLFNRFTPLPQGQARSDVLALAERAGVDVGAVLSVDASRRTTAANAYVAGLGATKRVVLYDTLLDNFEPDELRLVVAHELAHVRHRDVPQGLLYLAIVAPFGLLAVDRLTRRLAPAAAGRGPAAAGPAVVPALALSVLVMATLIGAVSNQLSRAVEARADSYALELTGEPEPFIRFERRIALRNLADPRPPGWQTFLLATHPPAIERIGIGLAYARGARG